ncbi:MAG: hypothetical protein GY752_00540 [bacterium]|nr:hypothetical protein [bacterium]MCP4800972.1 hypothetical protein [bacterium]
MKTVQVIGLILLLCGAAFAQDVDVDITGRTVFCIHYDDGLQSQDFSSYITDADEQELNFNPRDTRIGFKAISTDGPWTFKSVFEVDFYGTNASNNLIPRLRLGYAEAANSNGLSMRFGQDWLPIAQQFPGTVDFGVLSWGGNLWWRVPQVTARYNKGNIETLASLATHRNSNQQEIDEKMPWVMGRIAAKNLFGTKAMVALGGGFRSVIFAGNEYSSHVIAAEFKLPIGKTLINGELYSGQGVGREFVRYGLDYNPTHPDGATEMACTGGFVNLKVPANCKLDFNVGIGMDDPEDDNLEDSTAPYLKNTVIYANMKYKMTKQFGFGVEYNDYETIALDEVARDGSRLTFAWWYIF